MFVNYSIVESLVLSGAVDSFCVWAVDYLLVSLNSLHILFFLTYLVHSSFHTDKLLLLLFGCLLVLGSYVCDCLMFVYCCTTLHSCKLHYWRIVLNSYIHINYSLLFFSIWHHFVFHWFLCACVCVCVCGRRIMYNVFVAHVTCN